MRDQVVISVIAAIPPTLAAILGFLATKRSLRRSVGASPGASLAALLRSIDTKIERIDAKVDKLAEANAEMRERLSRLEAETHKPLWSPPG
jgi:hypothetical protein